MFFSLEATRATRLFTKKTSGLGQKCGTEDGFLTTPDPIFVGISVAEFPSIWEQEILPSSITATWNFHSKLKPKKNRPSIIRCTRFFGVNTQTHHGNVALPFLRCLKVYLMRWRFFGGSKSWPLFQSGHFFFFLFGYQQGEGEGFYHHNLSKLQIFQICFVACSLTPRYKYLIVNRPLGDEVFRPKRKVSSEKTMQKHRWKFESKILRLRLRGCCQKAVGKPHAYNMYKHAYKTHINTQYIGIFGMYVPLSKLHKCR